MEKIGSTLKALRKKQGLTQQELADRLFVTKQAVSKWETDRGFPDLSLIRPLAVSLGIPVEELLGNPPVQKKANPLRRWGIPVLLLGLSVLITLAAVNIIKYLQIQHYVKNIETSVNIALPAGTEFKDFDFQDWIVLGNAVSVTRMGYAVFDDDRSTLSFETALPTDEKWRSVLVEGVLEELPREVLRYTENGDYFLLYHPETDQYNQILPDSGEERYFFLIYQTGNHRILFFDFTLG